MFATLLLLPLWLLFLLLSYCCLRRCCLVLGVTVLAVDIETNANILLAPINGTYAFKTWFGNSPFQNNTTLFFDIFIVLVWFGLVMY